MIEIDGSSRKRSGQPSQKLTAGPALSKVRTDHDQARILIRRIFGA